VTSTTNSKTQNILQGGNSFTNITSQDQVSDRTRHKLTSVYEWQIDSSSSIKATVRASNVKSLSKSNFLGESVNEAGFLLNSSNRTTTTDDNNNTVNSNIFWRKKFKKTGRTISLNSDLNFTDRVENILLVSANKFYDKTGAVSKPGQS
jgi:hypothetical protein